MADEEKAHATILAKKAKEEPYELQDSHTLAQAKSIFNGIQDIKSDVKDIMSQLDFYRVAVENEKQSIDLYTKYLKEAVSPSEKALFDYLIKQERQHYEILDELAALLQNAEEWVEFAEFGIRKEYWYYLLKNIGTTYKEKGDEYDVSCLGYPHRHIFHFKVWIEVVHNDRDIEFIQFKRWLESLYNDAILNLDYKSCEMMSDDLYTQIAQKYPDRKVWIEVSEDGENGSFIQY